MAKLVLSAKRAERRSVHFGPTAAFPQGASRLETPVSFGAYAEA